VIRVNCPSCGGEFAFANYLAGLSVICKKCSRPISVPASGSTTTKDGLASGSHRPDSAGSVQYQREERHPADRPGLVTETAPATAVASPAARGIVLPASNPNDAAPLPDWAFEHARASLNMDISAGDIEKQLIARGLAPMAASEVMVKALRDQSARQREVDQRATQRLRVQKILAGVVAGVCLALAYEYKGFVAIRWTAIMLVLPLTCIWLGDKARLVLRYWFVHRFNRAYSTPDVMVRIGGWLLLAALLFRGLILLSA
jgi:hypothetical protein